MKCPKCNSINIIGVEYAYGSPERYDGVSQINCRDCHKAYGRWTQKEIPQGFCESRYGENGLVKIEKNE